MTLTLFHAPRSRSTTARWMLEEIGTPYEIRSVSIAPDTPRDAEHLAANPMGKVPTLNHNGTIVTEAAAICAYLADMFPDADLCPKPGTPERGSYYRWMFYAGTVFEPAIIDKAMKREPGQKTMMPYGTFDLTIDTTAAAVAKGPFLLGEKFTAADVVLGSGIRWTMLFEICPKRPEFVDYVERLEARPALRRQIELDDALANSLE